MKISTLILILTVTTLCIVSYTISLQMTGKMKLACKASYDSLCNLETENANLKKQINYLEHALRELRVTHAIVTSYSPQKGETDDDPYITASMQHVREGTIAVSRDLFYKGWVFGREVYIEGEGIFEITDLMHKRKTNQVDIFRFSTEEALKFGRKKRRIALLD